MFYDESRAKSHDGVRQTVQNFKGGRRRRARHGLPRTGRPAAVVGEGRVVHFFRLPNGPVGVGTEYVALYVRVNDDHPVRRLLICRHPVLYNQKL